MKRRPSIAPLPDALQDHLSALPAPDRALLEEAWNLAEHSRPPVTIDPARKAALWAVLQAETAPRRRRRYAGPLLARLAAAVTAPMWAPRLAFAAVVVVLIGVGLSLWQQPETLQTLRGETRAGVTLPDGSVVDLNSGTVLTLDFDGVARVVRLEGEAYFDVVADGRPFVVETFNAQTTVLGTAFNVRARADDIAPTTRVDVISGRVAVASRVDPSQRVVLKPGLYTDVAEARVAPPDSVLLRHALAWRDGGLVFINKQPFGVIFAELERRFDVHIQASAAIQHRPYNYTKFQPAALEDVLGDLTHAANLRFRATANGYEVYSP